MQKAAEQYEQELQELRAKLEETRRKLADLQQTQDEVRKKYELLAAFVHHLPAAAMLAEGDDLRVILANSQYQAFAPGKQMLGNSFEEIWPELAPEVAEIYRRVLATGEPFSIADAPYPIRRSTHGPLEDAYFSWSLHRIPLPGDNRWGVLGTAWETTQRKQAQEALIRSEKLASVGRLASTIAHEINNPLETIGQAIYLASNDPAASELTRSYLKLAAQDLERVSHITRQILAFNRGATTSKPIDIRATAEDVLRLFAARLTSRGIVVQKRYAEQLGLSELVESDIRQIISTLITNSMDAMPEGGRLHLRVSRVSFKGLSRTRLTIADCGIGMSPEQRTRAFEAFFTTKDVVGTGLGLWMTKQIVEKHNATIQMRSKQGKGTVFSILFPAQQ